MTKSRHTARVIYRIRIYQGIRESLPAFHDFFRTRLLPVQKRHGARLVGRWEAEDGRVVAIWEYDDRASYARIQTAVASDPESEEAQRVRGELPAFFTTKDEVFMKAAPAAEVTRRLHAEG